jgi:hypothetical protein
LKKSYWQRRIEKTIVQWRKDLGCVEEVRKGMKVGERIEKVLIRKYDLGEKGARTESDMLKGKIKSGSTKITNYL